MFIHHVFFWLKNSDNALEREQLSAGLQSLLSIKLHIAAHVGVPAGTSRGVIDTSYDFSLLLTFESAEDEEAYQVHPTHDAFRENCHHLWSKVIVYDSVDV
ncbi:MAG: stress responsive alpha-beta barrel protein [Sphingobacteriaceae bacterium]|jgi:hypothetical protein|nr:stress responsive alpha-beta barrel protein [Sphingobacteriaceae bacterium]